MPTAKKIEQLQQQQQQAAAAHTLKMLELEQAIEAAKAAAAAENEAKAAADREALLSESFKELRELPAQINKAAAAYLSLVRQFAELAPHTASRTFTTGAVEGEANTSPKILSLAGSIPFCFTSDDGDKVYLTNDIYQPECDRAHLILLSDAIKLGDVGRVAELMRDS